MHIHSSNKAFSSSKIFRLNEDKTDSTTGSLLVSSEIGAQNTKLIVIGSYYGEVNIGGGGGGVLFLQYIDTNNVTTLVDGIQFNTSGKIGSLPKQVRMSASDVFNVETNHITLMINTTIKSFGLYISAGSPPNTTCSGRVYTNFYFIPTM